MDDSQNSGSGTGNLEDSFEFQTPPRAETKVEAFLKRTLLERHLITSEQLQECLDERIRQSPPPPLAIVLLKKGYLGDEQLEELLHALSSKRKATGGDSLSLGESAVSSGLASGADILSALEIQEREGQKGSKPRLGEVLIRRGTLSVGQVKDILEKQGRRILRCSRCDNQYNVDSYSSDRSYSCLNCGSDLTDSGPVSEVGVDGTAADRGSAMQSLDDLFIGRRVGPCEITDKLGEGGMGTVYRAKHIALNKTVAIKIMSPAVMGAAHRQRFLREARTAASLEHPNIVVVHDTGEELGFPYIVMQYIEGKSLAEILHVKGKLPPKQALRIVMVAASALGAAHARKLVHRDIKPDNIMLTTKGEVKVTDFGLAKSIQKGDMALTATGTIMGTPLYMSPEQFEGKPVDQRSDIYSLGVTLYDMLAGAPPFTGDTVLNVWRSHVKETPPPLGKDIPERLRDIVFRMLQKNPKDRYQNAAELIADLKEVYLELGGEEEEEDFLVLVDSGTAAFVDSRRKRLTRIALLCVIVVLMGLLAAMFLRRTSPELTHPTAEEAGVFNSARERADRLALDRNFSKALDVWDDFEKKNTEEFWTKLVDNERERTIQIANSTLSSMLDECGRLVASGNWKLAKEKCSEIIALGREIDGRHSQPSIKKLLKEADGKLATIEKGITRETDAETGPDVETIARWKEARKLAEKQLKRSQFALARFTCLPFTSSDCPMDIRAEAESKIEEINAKEQLHEAMLIEQERARFEQDMLEARSRIKLRDYENAGKIVGPYLEHEDREFRKEAQRILLDLRSAQSFTAAMENADRLRREKDFASALQWCRKYVTSANSQWAREANERLLQIKKERFLDRNLVYVQDGQFPVGSSDKADNNPSRQVSLESFYIGKFEITNADYHKFVSASGHRAPDNWPDGKPGKDLLSLPVVLITAADAKAYCEWLSKREGVTYRIPTEDEWEIAASWEGTKKLTYPWGMKFRKDACNIDGTLLPVGRCKGDISPSGVCDMAGNACELTARSDGRGCVIRGGCCDDNGNSRSARVTYRQECQESTTGSSIGFRIVRTDK